MENVPIIAKPKGKKMKISEIQKACKRASDDYKQLRSASDALQNYEGARQGPRGGKRTTLSARADLKASAYRESLDYLEELLKEAVKEGIEFHQ